MLKKSALRHFSLLSFFALVGFLALYNPLFHNGTAFPGNKVTDYYHFHWSYWWVRHALTTPELNVYHSNFVMFPTMNNLAYHTMAIFWLPVWAALEPLVGTLAAMNWVFLVAFMLTGYLMFVFLKAQGVPNSLALLAGVTLEVSPLMLRAVWWTNPNLIGAFWFPAHLLLWDQVVRDADHRWRGYGWALLQGAALWGAILTDLQYGMFIPFLLAPYVLFSLITHQRRLRLMSLGTLSLIFGLLLLYGLGPLPALLSYQEGAVLRADVHNTWGIYFPVGYLWNAADYFANPRIGGVALIVFVGAVLVNLGRRRRAGESQTHPYKQKLWLWLILAIIPLVLSFGATVRISGHDIPMPYRLYHAALGGLFRFPERFGTVFMVAGLTFAALTFAPLTRRRHVWIAALGLPLIMLNLRTLHPMDIQPAPKPYAFYEMMGAEDQLYTVIEVPTAAGSAIEWVGDPAAEAFQFYGAQHGKRMINGHLTRIATDHWWYLRTDDPLLSWLGQRRYLEPDLVEPEMGRIIFDYPVGYFVIHQEVVGRGRGANEEIIGYFNSLPDLLCPPLVEGEAVMYRTRWHPKGCTTTRTPAQNADGAYTIDIGTAGDELFLGAGWHYPEPVAGITWRWAGSAAQTDLYVDLPAGDYDISLAAQAYDQPRQLTMLINGVPLEDTALTVSNAGLGEYHFSVPAKLIGNGQHLKITLVYDGWAVPAELVGGGDTRRLALAVDWISFRP